MVAVMEEKLVFGRDQVVTSTQASKNFGDMRKRARTEPQFVDDRNDGIDTVIVSFDTFEAMAVELQQLREEHLHAVAAVRIAQADADPKHQGIALVDVLGKEEHDRLFAAEIADNTPDSDLFE